MRRRAMVALPAVLVLALPLSQSAAAAPSSQGVAHRVSHVCSAPAADTASCNALRRDTIDSKGHVTPNATPRGYGPADIQSAYKLAGTSSGGRTVAIVDAYHDPKAASDLATYRSHFGLPACTAANGCFKQVNQNGAAAPLPATDYGWALEISLDLDMVSATCPDCHILLVEANSATDTDLYKAVDTAAATPGVIAISNSYGGAESATQVATSDPHFNHPGVAITASSGDSGYGTSYPAASQYVTAVGGTSLTKASNARG